jgi:hypothetical protein
MSYDDRQLEELLRLLRPAPEALVARVKELPLHFDEDPDALGDDADDGEAGPDTPPDDHHALPPDDLDAYPDGLDDDDDSPDGDWG